MTPQEFIEAVRAMRGLDQLMSEHLTMLADKLSDEERGTAVAKLQIANEMIEKALEDQVALYKEGEQVIHKEMQKIAKVEEKGEHDQEAADAESLLNTL